MTIKNKLSGLKSVTMAMVILCLINLPFWILSYKIYLLRPLINIDAAIVFVIAWWAPFWAVFFLISAWIFDVLQSMSLVYHFNSLNDFIKSFEYLKNINLKDFLDAGLYSAVVVFIVSGFLLLKSFNKFKPKLIHYLMLIVLTLVIDVVNGSSGSNFFGRDSYLIEKNVIGSPGFNVAVENFKSIESQMVGLKPIDISPGAKDIYSWAEKNSRKSILIIVVESLGLHRNANVNDWLDSQIYTEKMSMNWILKKGDVPFKGATTSGELRTLCQLSGHYKNLNENNVSSCLPMQLKKLGWHSHAIHGFTKNMFDRLDWWHKLGFNEMSFSEDFDSNVPRCGKAFNGVCDSYLVRKAVKATQTPQSFQYLLTLNTHLPLTQEPIPEDVNELCMSESLGSQVCQLIAQQGKLLRVIKDELEHVESPPLVLIVGDHAPPFSRLNDRVQFHEKNIPYYFLTPK